MKKIILSLAAILVLSVSGFCQDKGYIGLSLGSSTPMGDFASNNPNNNNSGYAKGGAIFDISFGYKLGKYLGVAALLRGQANPTDAQAIADQIANANPGVSTVVSSKSWGVGGLMVGGYASVPISAKYSFEPRVLIGFLNATSPDITVTVSSGGNSAWIKEASASASAFSYLLGIGVKHDVGKRICLLANVDYLGAKPEFSNVVISNSYGASSIKTFSQSFGTFNVGVGIGYRL